ncbi:MAG: CDP-diacylglycerol--glycerol-3-phosphate 3-phosphatidyltransferase [bacterium]
MNTLPNMLSFARILLIPVFILFFLNENYVLAGMFFSISAITDFFDGYFARKYNITTKLGKILDPFADKLTIISVLVVLIISNIIPQYIAIIILIREVFILISSTISYIMGFDFINPSKIGKLSIFILYVAIAIRLINFNKVAMILFYIVIPLNIYSAVNYISVNIKQLIQKNNK